MVDFIKRCTFKGAVGNGELWMAGFHFQHDNTAMDAAQTIASSAQVNLSPHFGDSVTWNSVKVVEVDEATGNTGPDEHEEIFSGAQGGGGNNLPPEVAVAVTIRTQQLGLTGRFYLPPPPVSACGPGGVMTSTWQSAMATGLFDFFQTDLGTATNTIRLGVYSRKNHAYYGASGFDVGNVFDAQRRRRNKLTEARVGFNIA